MLDTPSLNSQERFLRKKGMENRASRLLFTMSGWKVNGTRFESFHQKISGSNGTSEKVVLFCPDGTLQK